MYVYPPSQDSKSIRGKQSVFPGCTISSPPLKETCLMMCSNVMITTPIVKSIQSDARSAEAAVNLLGNVHLTGNNILKDLRCSNGT